MEAVTFVEPESLIEIPANLTLSSSFKIILLTPILYVEDVTYWVDILTAVNNPVTFKLPEMFTSFASFFKRISSERLVTINANFPPGFHLVGRFVCV